MSKKKTIVWVDLYTENIPAEVYPGADKIWPVMGKYLLSHACFTGTAG